MKLWKLGIPTLDYIKLENSLGFFLCSLVLWTVNYFPGYGLLSRCTPIRICNLPSMWSPNHISTFMQLEENNLHGPFASG